MRCVITLLFQFSLFIIGAQENAALKWQNYDFVPGEEIIFNDNQQGEQNGEFPCKWDLVGGSVENANLFNENIIMFVQMGAYLNKNGYCSINQKPGKRLPSRCVYH
ncbi:MAG: hypothetical protein HC831_06045 [Chloroflexia bacterium]|nr:hypothetical protein [Chloroflexia bacterium]